MGRRANASVDSVSDQSMALDLAAETAGNATALTVWEAPMAFEATHETSRVPAFVLGTVIGALAGALLGTLLSPHTRAYLVGLYQLVSRRMSTAERDKLRGSNCCCSSRAAPQATRLRPGSGNARISSRTWLAVTFAYFLVVRRVKHHPR